MISQFSCVSKNHRRLFNSFFYFVINVYINQLFFLFFSRFVYFYIFFSSSVHPSIATRNSQVKWKRREKKQMCERLIFLFFSSFGVFLFLDYIELSWQSENLCFVLLLHAFAFYHLEAFKYYVILFVRKELHSIPHSTRRHDSAYERALDMFRSVFRELRYIMLTAILASQVVFRLKWNSGITDRKMW